ncbi:MAG TPA: DUF3540 domain-containing protein [Byssovorax sp.]|jgi:hypothetical protein
MKRKSAANNKVVQLARRRALELEDGAVATIEDGALELRDKGGRLLVRYANGSAEIAAPSGDLVLSSASGRVVLQSALDVEVNAARDIVHRAARSVDLAAGDGPPQLHIEPQKTVLKTPRVRADVGEAELVAGVVATAARAIATTATTIAVRADKYELVATRLVEKTKDAFRDVTDLAQTRVGRARTLVSTIFSLRARRTVVASDEDTSIDGRKILLG